MPDSDSDSEEEDDEEMINLKEEIQALKEQLSKNHTFCHLIGCVYTPSEYSHRN